jgi:hypothetical protein
MTTSSGTPGLLLHRMRRVNSRPRVHGQPACPVPETSGTRSRARRWQLLSADAFQRRGRCARATTEPLRIGRLVQDGARGSRRTVMRRSIPPELGSVTSGIRTGHQRIAAASVLQASGLRSDVTVFRLNATAAAESGLEPAFRRNTAERAYGIEAAHNPEVAGSNPAPATAEAPETGPLFTR